MKKRYSRPELTEYGRATQLTLGGGDANIDFNIIVTAQNVSGNGGPGQGPWIVNGQCIKYCS